MQNYVAILVDVHHMVDMNEADYTICSCPSVAYFLQKNASGNVTLHVIPSFQDSHGVCEV